MSMHNQEQPPTLIQALKDHGLKHDEPSQLADAFRQGWLAATKEQRAIEERVAACLKACDGVSTVDLQTLPSPAEAYEVFKDLKSQRDELLDVAEGILVDDLLPYLPAEYIAKVRAAIAKTTAA